MVLNVCLYCDIEGKIPAAAFVLCYAETRLNMF